MSWDASFDGISSLAIREKPLQVLFGGQNGHVGLQTLEGATRSARETVLYKSPKAIRAVAISPDGQWSAAGGDDPGIRVWSEQNVAAAQVLVGHHGAVQALQFSPTGNLLSGGNDRSLRVWNPVDGRLESLWGGHQEPLSALSIDASDTRWASASWDKSLRTGMMKTGGDNAVTSLSTDSSRVGAVALSRDGQWLAAGSADRKVRLWSTQDGKLSREYSGHDAAVHALAFSSDGRRIFSAGRDTTIRIWDSGIGILAANCCNSSLSLAANG